MRAPVFFRPWLEPAGRVLVRGATDAEQLRKVVEDWNVTPGDGHLYFTFRPPWVTSGVPKRRAIPRRVLGGCLLGGVWCDSQLEEHRFSRGGR